MQNRIKLHTKIRFKLSGTPERPRLAVYRSLKNVTLQLIDDTKGLTLASATSIKEKGSLTQKAKIVGKQIAEKAKELKIKEAVYDRAGFQYHGVVKIACESAREAGLKI